jgi:Tfp pilus assembly PilM family ATPase
VALAVSAGRGTPVQITGWAVEPLPEGAVVPALNAANIARPADVVRAIDRAWKTIGHRPGRVALVVPDGVGKVSLVRFQEVPAKPSDLDELIKFQVRKAAPFRVEDSQITYIPGAATAEGREFIVVQARRDIVLEYETVCTQAGAVPGVVELATFGVSHCVCASGGAPAGDWLLIHAMADGASLAIFRGNDMVFFRHRGADGEGHLRDLVHQTAMYYQDRLGGSGFARVVVGGAPEGALSTPPWRDIQTRLGVAAETIDPGRAVAPVQSAPWSPGTMEAAVPALGVALSLRTDA